MRNNNFLSRHVIVNTAIYICISLIASEALGDGEIFGPVKAGFSELTTVIKDTAFPAIQALSIAAGGWAWVNTRSLTPLGLATVASGILQYMK